MKLKMWTVLNRMDEVLAYVLAATVDEANKKFNDEMTSESEFIYTIRESNLII